MQALTACYNLMAFVVALFFVAALLGDCMVSATPMLYKKTPDQKYEADLVAVSSTVIPLSALEVSYGEGGQPSEEYKQAYLKKLRKKVIQRARIAEGSQGIVTDVVDETVDAPDTLITINNKKKINEHTVETAGNDSETPSPAKVKDAPEGQQ